MLSLVGNFVNRVNNTVNNTVNTVKGVLNSQVQPQQPQIIGMQILRIIPRYSSYFIGDFVEGQVELIITNVQVILNDINLILNSLQMWTSYFEDTHMRLDEKKPEVIVSINLNIGQQLNMISDLITLNPGKYTFGFRFKIPDSINPSFEFPGIEGQAYIRYALVANIVSPYTNASTSTYLIIKRRQKIEMNKQVSFTTENVVHKWGLFDGGKTAMKITSINGSDNFKFGENVKFDINIDNTKGKMNSAECKVVLIREVVFKSDFGETKKTIKNELLTQTVKTFTKSGENKSFPFTLTLKNIENKNFNTQSANIPYTNVVDLNYFLPTINTFILECKYSLEFTLDFEKFVKNSDLPKITMNIIICHQSMDEYNQEMNQRFGMNYNNAIPNPNFNQMNMNMNVPPMNNENPPPPVSQMSNVMNNNMDNNMNNINTQDDELPSMEEIEHNNFNQPQNQINNFNNNFNNNNNDNFTNQ